MTAITPEPKIYFWYVFTRDILRGLKLWQTEYVLSYFEDVITAIANHSTEGCLFDLRQLFRLEYSRIFIPESKGIVI